MFSVWTVKLSTACSGIPVRRQNQLLVSTEWLTWGPDHEATMIAMISLRNEPAVIYFSVVEAPLKTLSMLAPKLDGPESPFSFAPHAANT